MTDDTHEDGEEDRVDETQRTESDGGLADLGDVLTEKDDDKIFSERSELEFPDRSGDDGQDLAEPEDIVGDHNPAKNYALAAVALLVAGAFVLAVRFNPLGLVSGFLAYGLAAASGALVATAAAAINDARDDPIRLPDPEVVDGRPEIVEPPTAAEKRSRFGVVGKLLAEYNTRRQRKKLGGQGYVEWYLIEDGWPRPKYVKPKIDATNLPYYKYKGERYFFPERSRLADERGGVWVVIHQRGDADPINLKEPKDHSLPASAVERWAKLVVQTKEGLFGGLLDLTPQEIFRYGIYAFIGYMILRTALQNGVIPGL